LVLVKTRLFNLKLNIIKIQQTALGGGKVGHPNESPQRAQFLSVPGLDSERRVWWRSQRKILQISKYQLFNFIFSKKGRVICV